MLGSQTGPPASSAAVAFGIGLLFATGALGFYLLVDAARPGSPPPPPAPRRPAPLDEEPAPPAPSERIKGNDPVPEEPVELPDFFPVPNTMMTGAIPSP